ncbi:hypothetical protein [Streptomyces sp. NPDC001450]
MRELGADGHELRLAVNHEPLDFADPEPTRGYNGVSAYRRSKCGPAGTGVSVNVPHPATTWTRR